MGSSDEDSDGYNNKKDRRARERDLPTAAHRETGRQARDTTGFQREFKLHERHNNRASEQQPRGSDRKHHTHHQEGRREQHGQHGRSTGDRYGANNVNPATGLPYNNYWKQRAQDAEEKSEDLEREFRLLKDEMFAMKLDHGDKVFVLKEHLMEARCELKYKKGAADIDLTGGGAADRAVPKKVPSATSGAARRLAAKAAGKKPVSERLGHDVGQASKSDSDADEEPALMTPKRARFSSKANPLPNVGDMKDELTSLSKSGLSAIRRVAEEDKVSMLDAKFNLRSKGDLILNIMGKRHSMPVSGVARITDTDSGAGASGE